jgi:hypothetical protein
MCFSNKIKNNSKSFPWIIYNNTINLLLQSKIETIFHFTFKIETKKKTTFNQKLLQPATQRHSVHFEKNPINPTHRKLLPCSVDSHQSFHTDSLFFYKKKKTYMYDCNRLCHYPMSLRFEVIGFWNRLGNPQTFRSLQWKFVLWVYASFFFCSVNFVFRKVGPFFIFHTHSHTQFISKNSQSIFHFKKICRSVKKCVVAVALNFY